MRRLISGVPALVLLIASAAMVVSGVGIVGYGLLFTGSGAGIRAVAVGAALVVSAVVITIVPVGILQRRRWAFHAGLAIAGVGILVALWVGRTALQVDVLVADRTGKLQPQYDTGRILIALSGVPFAAAPGCLVAAERQPLDRRRSDAEKT